MLPWRRRKFVFVEEETKTNPKSMGVGGTYGSIIWSLIHSCHDVLPNCPFERLGRIFRTKRQKVELNKEDPIYTVCYLGSAVTLNGKGEGCTEEVVGKIWSRSGYGGQGTKMKLIIGPQGIQLGPSGKNKPSHLFYLHRITCCMADARRPKIFTWVYRHQIKNKAVVLRCHAVMVAKAEKARTMALSLSQASSSAFSEFKRLQRQSDFRHVRQQLLGEGVVPLIPMRKLLNGQCRYRPPTDMPPSACQLSSITEEDEEEEDGGSEHAESESYAAHSPRKDTGETASHRSNAKYSARPSAAG